MLKIIKLLRPHWKAVIAVIGLLLVQALCELKLPGLMSDIVDIGLVRGGVADADAAYMAQVAAGGADVQVQMRYMWLVGGKMALIAMAAAGAAVTLGLISARVGSAIGRDLRRGVFTKVVGFSHTELDKFSTASLITRCTNDIMQVQMTCVMLLRMVLYAPIMGAGGVIKVAAARSGLGWIVAAAVGGLFLLLMVLLLVAMPKFKKMQELVDNVNLVSREILTGLPVIRAFARERYEEQRFDGANTALRNTQLFTGRTMASMMPFMNLIMYGISIAIVWFGAQSIQAGSLEIGDMMAFTNYAMQIVFSFMMLSMISIMAPRAIVAAERIYEVLDTENVIHAPEQGRTVQGSGEISFRDVSFRYPGAEDCALEHISFTARPGETTAIIGSTGCGKTTLLNLILRFYDVTEGSITLDGVDLREIDLAALRGRLGYVPQKAVLFSGDIASNIGYAGNVPTERIEAAAQVAQAAAFISEKPEGFASHIAQGGSNVSGGQKQRLSIARVFLKNPPILIFDEATSALDNESEKVVQESLEELAKNRTTFVIAHRLSTIRNAERIIVLSGEGVAEEGTHQELLERGGVYAQLYEAGH